MKDASKRLVVFSTALGLLLICAGVLIPYLGAKDLAGVIGFERAQVRSVDLQDVSSQAVLELSEEQTDTLMALLNQLQVRRAGKAQALQGCYARLFFETEDLGEIELMLAPEKLLINPTSDSAASSWVYRLEQADNGLQDYITGLIPA